jgi:predicted deacetylase
MSASRRTLAVALHDIEPATFERCALIRDWLDDHGVGRVTLLVIPARDLHPLAERSPEMVSWLIEREHSGDAIAQHGFQHLRPQRMRGLRRALSPALLRAGTLVSGATLRLDLDHPSHMLALEYVLKRSASCRDAVTYDELARAAEPEPKTTSRAARLMR